MIDIFAGTASVAKAASSHFPKIIINDILHANNIIYKAFFKDDYWDKDKIEELRILITEQTRTIKMLQDKIDLLEGNPKPEEPVSSYRRPKNRPVTISSEDDYFPSAVAAITAIYDDSSSS